MTIVELRAATYGTYALLVAISAASVTISKIFKSRRIGGVIRTACLLLTVAVAALFYALAFALHRTEATVATEVAHLYITTIALSVAWALTNFGTRREWARFWDFPRPAVPVGMQSCSKVDHHRLTRGWLHGWILHLAGVALVAVDLLCTFIISLGQTYWLIPLVILGGIAGVKVANQGREKKLQARRAHARRIESPSELPPGSYVLYLRMFDVDEEHAFVIPARRITMDLTDMLLAGSSEEEDLAMAMRPVGPMIAVGIPGEELPHAGAMRMYLPKTDWKPVVGQLIKYARLVVIELGTGAGTMWEVMQSLSTLPPQRLLLITPEGMPDGDYERVRKHLRREMHGKGKLRKSAYAASHSCHGLPPRPGRGNPHGRGIGFMHFSEGWRAASSTGFQLPWHPTMDFFSVITKALTPLFDELRAYEERTGRFWG